MTHQTRQADLARVAADYKHSVSQNAVLQNYKDSILLLRAKSASYEKIAELLTQRDIKVSAATIRKFCRKYQDEANKIRAQIEDDIEPTAATPPVREQRPPLTNDPGKRGPRPARDQL